MKKIDSVKFNIDYRAEDFLLNTKWEDFPEEVQKRALVCSIDLMHALILGSCGKQYEAGLRMARGMGSYGNVPVIGTRDTFSFWGATVALCHASNSFDIDDGHNMIKGHPGTSFVAGVLAAALERNVTYKEYLTALVVSYETTIRCALALHDYYEYFHSTGAYGGYGTAAGAGRLLGMSREQLNNALSMAEFHGPLVTSMRSVEYPSMNKDGVPFGAMVGALSILDTFAGSTAIGNLLEMPQYQHFVDTLGKEYEILNLYFKPYTCCRWAHPAIAACVDTMREHKLTQEQIEKVSVYTFDAATKLSKMRPSNTDEAQYNIAYPVAAAIVKGDCGYAQVCDEGLNDPDVLAMLSRLEFLVDEELEALFPAQRLCRIEILTKDGAVYRSDRYRPDGEAQDHVDMEWEEKKFRRITAPLMTADQQTEILDLLRGNLDVPVYDIVQKINRIMIPIRDRIL